MRLLDISFKSPARNLALDEVLLDEAERGHAGETLRFWESACVFVVLGVSQSLREEVFEKACWEDGIPVLRRCSAGGCVVQGPGCLNYALVLSHDKRPELQTVRGSYCYIFDEMARSFAEKGVSIMHRGVSDLTLGTRKVSGNAQRRRRRWILHHGTLLYGSQSVENGDEPTFPLLDAIEKYLRVPLGPTYRHQRGHRAFVRPIALSADELRATVSQAFGVKGPSVEPSREELRETARLAREKYLAREWTHRR